MLLLALGVRAYRLTWHSAWLDDTSDMLIATQYGDTAASLRAFWQHNLHTPPLHFLYLKLLLELFGADALGPLRAGYALAGVATVLVVALAGRQLLGPAGGLLAALLLALHPFQVFWDQEIRMYALLALWSALMLGCFFRYVASGSRAALAGFALATVLNYYTHYYPLLLWGAANLALVLCWRKRWRAWLVAQLVIVALFLPWAPVLVANFSGSGRIVAAGIGPDRLLPVKTFLTLATGYPVARSWHSLAARYGGGLLTGLLLATALAATVRSARRRRTRLSLWLLFLVPCLGAWAIAWAKSVFAYRFLIIVLPALVLLLADRIVRARRVAAAAILAAALVGLYGYQLGQYYTEGKYGQSDVRGAVAAIAAREQPGDALVVAGAYMANPFRYYYRGPNRIADFDFSALTDLATARASLDASGLARRRVWLFLSDAEAYDPRGLLVPAFQATMRLEESLQFHNVQLYRFAPLQDAAADSPATAAAPPAV